MTSKKFNREQMQRCLDVLEQLEQSGLSTQDFAQTQGASYGHRCVDVLELCVAIRALIALEYLDIGLQTVVLAFEELAHNNMAYLMARAIAFEKF